jgi:hypothetical protein
MPPAEPEPTQRPFPDPDRSLAPRRPRTPGGVVYLAVLAVTLAGIVVVALGRWQLGLTAMGAAFLAGALARLVLREDAAGMLKVRRKLVDVFMLALIGAGLVAVALVIPPQPPL